MLMINLVKLLAGVELDGKEVVNTITLIKVSENFTLIKIKIKG